MDYSKDYVARYFAMRVLENQKYLVRGIAYETAITSTRTTQAALDWWIVELTPGTEPEPEA